MTRLIGQLEFPLSSGRPAWEEFCLTFSIAIEPLHHKEGQSSCLDNIGAIAVRLNHECLGEGLPPPRPAGQARRAECRDAPDERADNEADDCARRDDRCGAGILSVCL
jgi:hypothetical protein